MAATDFQLLQRLRQILIRYALKQLCDRIRDGSHATQHDRRRALDHIANHLQELGFRQVVATGLKPKHVEALVERWKLKGLAAGTIMNRMADVLDAWFVVKREEFVPSVHQRLAFADTELPLGRAAGACMFAPKVEVLAALQSRAMKKHDNVLEIDTGSGYMATLLGAHADHVCSIEIGPDLAGMTLANLHRVGVTNASVEVGKGVAGLPAHAPYDSAMVPGAVAKGLRVLREQLKPAGRRFAKPCRCAAYPPAIIPS